MGYKVINLKDIYNAIGEEETKEILKDYKCDLNKDVEYFIKEKAIEFSKQDIAETFIVTSLYKQKQVIVGYFSIANKVTNVKKIVLSHKKRKRFLRYAKNDAESNSYFIALPLLGQIGKNFSNGYNALISGDELLKLATDKIRETQAVLGGRFIYLECEDKAPLIQFYSENGFVEFGKRNLERDELDKQNGAYLIQMLKYMS